jgi:hypothetical protein
MRPQDIVVCLKILGKQGQQWQFKQLAAELYLSPAEITLAMERNVLAGLVTADKQNVNRLTLIDFIEYGLHVVFPAVPGSIVNGLVTAHSHQFMQQYFTGDIGYVWPHVNGLQRGQGITPLYKQAVSACLHDEVLYKMLALIDVIRVGKTRELKVALAELKRMVK